MQTQDGWYCAVGERLLIPVRDRMEGELIIAAHERGEKRQMTFEEWQGTKRRVEAGDKSIEDYQCAEGTEAVYVYDANLIIEMRPDGRFMLQLPMEEEVGDELEALERRLYQFGLGEGLIAQ